MDVLGGRIGSSELRRGAGVALVAVPLAAAVGVLAWRGVAAPLNWLSLLALGVGLMAFGQWVRRGGWVSR